MKFLADRTLGRLAKGLRMLGYDTVYYRGEDRHGLLHLARSQDRVILTRNTKLVPGRPEDRIILIQEDKPLHQLRELMGKQLISVRGEDLLSRCLLCNAEEIAAHLIRRLGIHFGETSADRKYTLLEVECLGSCGTSPVIQINDTYYEDLTPEKVDQILDSLK